MSDLRIATRRSALALAQARRVAQLITAAKPDVRVDLVEVTTTGDTDIQTPVTTLTEVGAFVKAVQQAVLEGVADIAVHSCKDLPVDGPDELVTYYPERDAPWDVLCGHDLQTLPRGARIGTGSPRRAAQMRRLRPDVEFIDIRGNVDTRLAKMQSGGCDAVILAESGLRRLGREDAIGHRFSIDEMVPAPAQAALAAEALEGSHASIALAGIENATARAEVEAERSLLRQTRAGCRSALGALGRLDGDVLHLTGFVEDEKGPRFARASGTGPSEAAGALKEALGL